MSVRISLTLEASEMFLSFHMIFSLERAAVVWAILERISGFDPSLEMIAPTYLKFSTSSSLWPFILISVWKPFGLFVISFVLSGTISILYLVVVISRRSTRVPASSSAFTTMSSAKRKLVISRPPMLTLPSWSSNASHIILSVKMLKRRGLVRVDTLVTPTVVLNHSPMLPWTGLHSGPCHADFQWLVWCWRWCCISSWLPIRLRAIPCQRPSWSLWRHGRDSADAAGISRRILRLNICSVVLLPALKPACSSAIISSACGWSLFRMIFNMTLLGWLIRLMVL